MAKKSRRRPPAERNGDELLALLDKPEEYQALSDEELDRFVYFAVGVYGMTSRPEFIPKVMALYEHYLQRVPAKHRMQNYFATQEQVVNREMSVNGLLPYLFTDDDVGVVSTAALDYAVLHPLEGNDPMTGPKSLLQLIRDKLLSNPAAAIGGMVMLGDQRVMGLLGRIRHQLSNTEVETVIRCMSGYLNAATIEFYLSWLEDFKGAYDDAIFGTIAAALCNLIRGASEPIVRSIERVFPSTPENAIRVLKSWPLEEYAKTVVRRLRAIAKWEKDPKVTPYVLEAWSLQ